MTTLSSKKSVGAPIGNRNALKGKLWNDALRLAITLDDGSRLRQAAEKLLDAAAEGQPWAIKEVADRLDGRSLAFHDVDARIESPLLKGIEISFVTPMQETLMNQ